MRTRIPKKTLWHQAQNFTSRSGSEWKGNNARGAAFFNLWPLANITPQVKDFIGIEMHITLHWT